MALVENVMALPPRVRAQLKPFTVRHFCIYASRLVFDDGERREPEMWQRDFVGEVFRSMKLGSWGWENWLVVPEGNGKTTLIAQLALYACDWAYRPWIPVIAHNRDQAKITYLQAEAFVQDTPGLARRFVCFTGLRQIQPLDPKTGKKRPGVGIKVMPWDPDSNDGAIPFPFFIGDELHRHPTLETWRLYRGKCRKRRAVGVGISTAGQPGEDFENARDEFRQQASYRRRTHGGTVYRGRRHSMVEFRLEDPEKWNDPKAVAKVNPLSQITAPDIAEELGSPTLDVGDFKRLKCNIAARSIHAAISDEEWAKAIDLVFADIPDGARRDCGLDLGWKHDTTALVEQWHNEEAGYHLWNEARVIYPPRDGSSLHPDVLKAALYAVRERGPIDALVMDMTDGEDIAAWAADELGITVVDRPQGNNLAVMDYKNVMRGLRTGLLRRVKAAPLLTRHAMNAIAFRLPKGDTKFERPNQSRAPSKQDHRVIDALVAGGMVYTHVCQPEEPGLNLADFRIKRL